MAILSRLIVRCVRPNFTTKNYSVIWLSPNPACRRWMSAGPSKMAIMASKLEWTVFKNELHYFVMLGLIPVGLIIAYTNLFIGQAQLSEIPEGYYPKPWEYHKHPISRFIAKHFVTSYEREYEKHLHVLNEDMKKIKVRRLEGRVKEVMSLRRDYKGWYYEPVNEMRIQKQKDLQPIMADQIGKSGPF